MARVLSAWPVGVPVGPRQLGYAYYWKQWLDGRVWALEPGVDYGTTTRKMRQLVKQACRHRKLGCRVKWLKPLGSLIIQAESSVDPPKL